MEKKNVLVRIEPEIEMALRELDPEKKMSLSRALEYIFHSMNLGAKNKKKKTKKK